MQNSNFKGLSQYRSPTVTFQKIQYSPIIFQNFGCMNFEISDWHLKKQNTKTNEKKVTSKESERKREEKLIKTPMSFKKVREEPYQNENIKPAVSIHNI